MQTPGYEDWYAQVKGYTTRLVNIRSVSPGQGEIAVGIICPWKLSSN